jgi:hypothetical protein
VGGAFRIIGGENAGSYFRHSDHLGSTSVLSDADGLRGKGSHGLGVESAIFHYGLRSEIRDLEKADEKRKSGSHGP